MNKSENINPKICRTCAVCCRQYSINYPKMAVIEQSIRELEEGEIDWFGEIWRFLDLESNGNIYATEEEECFSVVFRYNCRHLKNLDGEYSCSIYGEKRPSLCELYPYQKYECEKYIQPIKVFKDSASFKKRIDELKSELELLPKDLEISSLTEYRQDLEKEISEIDSRLKQIKNS